MKNDGSWYSPDGQTEVVTPGSETYADWRNGPTHALRHPEALPRVEDNDK
jgi:hypothetical protein